MHRQHHRHHYVRKGDSLYRISRRHGVPVVFLINLNPHLRSRPHRIHVGERIRVR